MLLICFLLVTILTFLLLMIRLIKNNQDFQTSRQASRKQQGERPTKILHTKKNSSRKKEPIFSLEKKINEDASDQALSSDMILGLCDEPDETTTTVNQPNANLNSNEEQPLIFTLYLMADNNKPYSGYELLQALLSSGLRFGERKIFHRYVNMAESADILFSLASIEEPGTFDLATIGSFSTSGLALFLECQYVEDPKQAFQIMMNTIDELSEDLGGTVYDVHKEVFSKESWMAMQSQLAHYIQSRYTGDLFSNLPVEKHCDPA